MSANAYDGADPKLLLKEVSQLLYNTPYSENMGEDKTGGIVWETNHGRDVWLLPGYFNTITKGDNAGKPKVERNITVPYGRRLFCVVGSSHATKFECRACMKSLIDAAREIDRLWKSPSPTLTVDGKNIKLQVVETDPFQVTIPDKDQHGKEHPAISSYGDLGYVPGPLEMVSIAHVALLDPLPARTQPYVIDYYAESPGKQAIKDIAYQVSVRYNVTVYQ